MFALENVDLDIMPDALQEIVNIEETLNEEVL